MKVVILAGGFGTRLREETEFKPKPMIEIGGKPMLWHIMQIYASQGFNDFVICTGYKNEVIKNYFLNYKSIENDFTVNLKSGAVTIYNTDQDLDWNVTVVDTGGETQTGGRIKRVQKYIGDNTFLATYGDGVADISIQNLYQAHLTNKREYGCSATLTASLSTSRFGEIEWNAEDYDYNVEKGGQITEFEEKSKTSMINGGFFIFEPEVFNEIIGDTDQLEKGVLTRLTKKGKLGLYKHTGFWGCIDTYKELGIMNDLWSSGNAPWKIW